MRSRDWSSYVCSSALHNLDVLALSSLEPAWNKHLAVERKGKTDRHHADDGSRLTVDTNHPSDNIRRRRKILLPHARAQQHHQRRTGAVIGGTEGASQHRLHRSEEHTSELQSLMRNP